jgi:flavin reductase (DIM6/NTAB) family NADH-FMN oxidoreductase RutF/DNA-binding IclR family transcriptional regulator
MHTDTGVLQFDSKRFRQVLGHYPTGVTVVTAVDADGQPAGMAVGSFTSVSLDPPLVAFLPDKSSTSFPRIRHASSFCVNVLSAEQENVCRAFAAKGRDKFQGLSWRPAASGAPILDGVVAWIDCEFEAIHESGDHYIVIGKVNELNVASQSMPLLFFQGGYGHFKPLSLTAPAETDIIEALLLVDHAKPYMEQVAAKLDVECLATTVVGDQMVILAATGRPRSNLVPTRVGQRVPFVPPLGALWLAWAAPPEVDAWLARVGPLSEDTRRGYLDMLARVRRRGWSIGLGDATHSELEAALARLTTEPGRAEAEQAVRRLIDQLGGEYEPEDLPAGGSYDVRNITAPVFGRTGEVGLTLSLYTLPRTRTMADIERYCQQLIAAADAITTAVGGRQPR